MDVTYNRLKKQVEARHGEVTFDKFGDIIVTCMEFVEHGVGDLNGLEKEEWTVEAVDKIWFEQTDRHIINKTPKGKDDGTSGEIEDLVRQLIRQVCKATKGKIRINDASGESKKNTGNNTKTSSFTGGTWKKKKIIALDV